MKMMMTVGLAVVGIGVLAARGGGLACAVDAALQEKGNTYIEWSKHKYQLQPVEVTDKSKTSHMLSGTLLHLNGKKDDTIAYRITKDKGAIKSIEVQVNSGMWFPLSTELNAALGDYRKTGNIDEDKQGTIHQALYKAGKDSDWKKTAELIVAFIAIRNC